MRLQSAERSRVYASQSASPRRSAILNEQLGLNVRVVPSTFSEDLDKSLFTPTQYAKETARFKALDVILMCFVGEVRFVGEVPRVGSQLPSSSAKTSDKV